MSHLERLSEWQRMHELLLAKEKELAERNETRGGGVHEEEMNRLQEQVVPLRLLADAVFQMASGVDHCKSC